MEILITGANGFVGRHLVQALQERGDNVRALASPTGDTSWLDRRDVAVFRGDVRAPDALRAPARGADAVINLAAQTGKWGPIPAFREVNVAGAQNVCRAALSAGVHRLVHVSTFTVYGVITGRPVTEDDPLAPLHEPYSVSKAEGDRLVQRMIREDHLPATVLRLGALLGPGDERNFGRLADRLAAGKGIIVGSGANAVPFVDVADVMQALLRAVDCDRALGQVYNVGNDQPFTQGQYLEAIAQELGVAPPRIHVPYQPLYASAYAAERISTLSGYRIPALITRHGTKILGADCRLAIDKARHDLGYVPQVPVRDGVRLAVAWYRQRRERLAADLAVVNDTEVNDALDRQH